MPEEPGGGTNRAPRGRLGSSIVLLGGPVVIKVWPLGDTQQLPVQAAWALLAGIGAACAPRWVVPVVLLSIGPWVLRIPRWPQAQELDFLRATVPTLGAETVHYDVTPPRSEKFKDVMERLGPARWTAGEGTVRYVGLSCYIGPTPPGCSLTDYPVAHTTLRPPSDLDVRLPEEPTFRLSSAGLPPI